MESKLRAVSRKPDTATPTSMKEYLALSDKKKMELFRHPQVAPIVRLTVNDFPVPLDKYIQSPPARRVSINASFNPCYPVDKMLRVVNAKQYCEKTYDS